MNQADIERLDKRSYAVACPWCHVPAGKRCVDFLGPLNWTHLARKWATSSTSTL